MNTNLDMVLVMLSILCVHAELKLKLQNISSCVVNFTVRTERLELFEKIERVKPNFLSLSAKNQVLILLYHSRTISKRLN